VKNWVINLPEGPCFCSPQSLAFSWFIPGGCVRPSGWFLSEDTSGTLLHSNYAAFWKNTLLPIVIAGYITLHRCVWIVRWVFSLWRGKSWARLETGSSLLLRNCPRVVLRSGSNAFCVRFPGMFLHVCSHKSHRCYVYSDSPTQPSIWPRVNFFLEMIMGRSFPNKVLTNRLSATSVYNDIWNMQTRSSTLPTIFSWLAEESHKWLNSWQTFVVNARILRPEAENRRVYMLVCRIFLFTYTFFYERKW
jgi:hypothetical protein